MGVCVKRLGALMLALARTAVFAVREMRIGSSTRGCVNRTLIIGYDRNKSRCRYVFRQV